MLTSNKDSASCPAAGRRASRRAVGVRPWAGALMTSKISAGVITRRHATIWRGEVVRAGEAGGEGEGEVEILDEVYEIEEDESSSPKISVMV